MGGDGSDSARLEAVTGRIRFVGSSTWPYAKRLALYPWIQQGYLIERMVSRANSKVFTFIELISMRLAQRGYVRDNYARAYQ